MSEWQPIETAPKDGSYFIAWDDGQGAMLFTAHWHKDEQRIYTEYERWRGPLTHWMPLPAPPVGSHGTQSVSETSGSAQSAAQRSNPHDGPEHAEKG